MEAVVTKKLQELKAYVVQDPLRHNGETYSPGDVVTLEPTAAAPLIALAVIALAAPPASEDLPPLDVPAADREQRTPQS